MELNVQLGEQSESSQDDKSQVWSTPQVPGCSNGQSLQFVVKDYGKGIEEKDFEKIFRPFTQASSETERLYGGTGLGLAITAKLVKALGGTVSVDSEIGKWTKMIVDLPLSSDSFATADVPTLSSQLENCSVVLLGGSAHDMSHVGKICGAYNVAFVSQSSLEKFGSALPKKHSGGELNAFVCLINEDIYNHDACKSLMASNPTKKMIFLTYGPEFRFKEAQGHYRSFSRMLPSVLIRTLGDYVKEGPPATDSCLRPRQVDGSATTSYQDLRVLLAEDNLVNQKVAKRILNRIGIDKIKVVENGKLAVEAEATGAYDLVLMDVQMPIMDGLEACKLIVDRQQGVDFPTMVVFCTAHVLDTFKVKCDQAGGSGFLSKPFRLQDVEAFLKTLPTPIGRWGLLDTTETSNGDD